MYSVTFSDGNQKWNTFDDWGLIQINAPIITPPEIETDYVNIPAMDGFLDLSEALIGRPIFKQREYKSEYTCIAKRDEWTDVISKIITALHGKDLDIYIDNDFTTYYSGRVSVGEPTMNKRTFNLLINAIVQPWRYETISRTTSIFCGVDETVSGLIIGTRKPAVPTIDVQVASGKPFHIVEWNGTSVDYELVQGDNFIPQLEIRDGENTVTIQSTGYGGTITFEFQGGML